MSEEDFEDTLEEAKKDLDKGRVLTHEEVFGEYATKDYCENCKILQAEKAELEKSIKYYSNRLLEERKNHSNTCSRYMKNCEQLKQEVERLRAFAFKLYESEYAGDEKYLQQDFDQALKQEG